MKTIKIFGELTYDDDLWHSGGEDEEALSWFKEEVLFGDDLLLFLQGEDTIGTVKLLGFTEDEDL
jgi:hypothetical protein